MNEISAWALNASDIADCDCGRDILRFQTDGHGEVIEYCATCGHERRLVPVPEPGAEPCTDHDERRSNGPRWEEGEGESRGSCIAEGCSNPVPWDQGSDYCATCIRGDVQ
jgi:hypothetical protein